MTAAIDITLQHVLSAGPGRYSLGHSQLSRGKPGTSEQIRSLYKHLKSLTLASDRWIKVALRGRLQEVISLPLQESSDTL